MPLTPRPRAEAVEALLRDLGGQLRPGGFPSEPPGRLPTGLPCIDRLLGGGIPRGRLSEIVGRPSSGRTGLALALLATATQSGETVAWVDAVDAFDPSSARAAGVELGRVLWIRPPRMREALRSVEHLLAARGFALVFLDGELRALPPAACLRFLRRAAATGTALVLLAPERSTGTFTELAIETEQVRTHFRGEGSGFEGFEARIELTRHRSAPPGERAAALRLQSAA